MHAGNLLNFCLFSTWKWPSWERGRVWFVFGLCDLGRLPSKPVSWLGENSPSQVFFFIISPLSPSSPPTRGQWHCREKKSFPFYNSFVWSRSFHFIKYYYFKMYLWFVSSHKEGNLLMWPIYKVDITQPNDWWPGRRVRICISSRTAEQNWPWWNNIYNLKGNLFNYQ